MAERENNYSDHEIMTKLQTEMEYTRRDIKELSEENKVLHQKIDNFIESVDRCYAKKEDLDKHKTKLDNLNKKVDNKIYRIMTGIIFTLLGVVGYLLKQVL